MSKADSLTSSQIKRILCTCLIMKNSESKRCAFVLSHSAIRVTEISLLQTQDILFKNGKIKEEVFLRASICKGLKSRTVWLSNTTTRQILQQWIDHRLKKKWGTSLNKDFQGLNPKSKFLFNGNGKPYSLQPKTRKISSGTKVYWACDALEQMFRELYKRCGLPKNSSHSGRKSLVSNSVKKGVSLEQLARILGHSDISTTLQYVVIDESRIKEMCAVDWM